jgi:hypothetical protein
MSLSIVHHQNGKEQSIGKEQIVEGNRKDNGIKDNSNEEKRGRMLMLI